jgi:molybdopterin/thiamine biosynthesis adenylyltransferase/rhodanese-related sulfurtransferase
MPLSPDELLRYSRHTLLPELGISGQERLKQGKVLIVGAGGLGSPAALYLAAAGVGTLGLVDFDAVDLTNLQRQVLYGTADVGRPKLEVAAERLRDTNPHTVVNLHHEALAAANARAIVRAYDIVLDGTDNFSARYLVNDACVLERRPNVFGSVFRFEGQAAVFSAADGPCYRCLHPEPPPAGLIPSCAEGGVLGVLPGIIGTIQATEAIKLITGVGEPLIGRIALYDALRMSFRTITLPRDPECPVCGDSPSIRELQEYDLTCEPADLQDQTDARDPTEMTVEELHAWRTENRPHTLIDVREPSEHAASRIEGAILVPLRQLQAHVKQLPNDRPVVVHCQSGGRSAIAVAMLKVQGFDARNLSGGIRAWNRRISE